MKRILLLLALLVVLETLAGHATALVGAELKPETLDGYSRYVRATQARIDKELGNPGPFLYLDSLPEPRRTQVVTALKRDEIFMERLETRDALGRAIHAPGGLIHHWLGTVFIPGATLDQVRAVVQDYDRHQDIYRTEVVRSRLIRREGNDMTIFYRLRKHKIITVTLNTEHQVHYTPVDSKRFYSRSYSTRIAEVENAGRSDEHERPVGHDGGFLWRADSWWRYEQRDGGVYMESEWVSLTRDVPTGLGWLINPFISSVPKESLFNTLDSTRAAVLARASGASGS